jgi:hypothetical protein
LASSGVESLTVCCKVSEDGEGWWWFQWHKNKTFNPQPKWVSELLTGFYTESYVETEENDYYHCEMHKVESYKGKWAKAYIPEKES